MALGFTENYNPPVMRTMYDKCKLSATKLSSLQTPGSHPYKTSSSHHPTAHHSPNPAAASTPSTGTPPPRHYPCAIPLHSIDTVVETRRVILLREAHPDRHLNPEKLAQRTPSLLDVVFQTTIWRHESSGFVVHAAVLLDPDTFALGLLT